MYVSSQNMKIIVGIPAFNEEKNIARILVKLQGITKNVIVCNDCSDDATGVIAEKMGATVINHQRNMGYGAGIRSIFLKAKEMDFDVLVTLDADGQHRIEDVASLIEPIKKGEADIVIGSRFLGKESNIPKYRKIGIKAITSLTNASTGKDITDSQSGLRAYSKKAVSEITPSDSGMGISTEILIKASKMGHKISEVPIVILYEGKTSTHHPISHGISVMASTIKFTSIEHPLKFYGIPGVVLLITGLFFTVWTISEFTRLGTIITNVAAIGIGTTILGTMLLITSILLYSLVSVVRERHD